MGDLLVVPIGEVENHWLHAAAACAEEMLHMPALLLKPLPVPLSALHVQRNQYLSTTLLELLLPVGRERGARVLAVEHALYTDTLARIADGRLPLAGAAPTS